MGTARDIYDDQCSLCFVCTVHYLGTGKSTTIWHVIDARVAPEARVLVTCTRNQAVDAVTEKLESFGVLVRIRCILASRRLRAVSYALYTVRLRICSLFTVCRPTLYTVNIKSRGSLGCESLTLALCDSSMCTVYFFLQINVGNSPWTTKGSFVRSNSLKGPLKA